jgi:hypothetical protein
MKNLILCIDIDDCLWPSNQTYLGQMNDSELLLQLNINRIKGIIKLFNAKIFITSSWSTILTLKKNKIEFKKQFNNDYYKTETIVLNILKQLDGNFIGLSCGDRRKDILKLLKNNVVIALDDENLTDISHNDFLFLETIGYITNRHGFEIKEFIKNKQDGN